MLIFLLFASGFLFSKNGKEEYEKEKEEKGKCCENVQKNLKLVKKREGICHPILGFCYSSQVPFPRKMQIPFWSPMGMWLFCRHFFCAGFGENFFYIFPSNTYTWKGGKDDDNEWMNRKTVLCKMPFILSPKAHPPFWVAWEFGHKLSEREGKVPGALLQLIGFWPFRAKRDERKEERGNKDLAKVDNEDFGQFNMV
jgi:hypothetical protein